MSCSLVSFAVTLNISKILALSVKFSLVEVDILSNRNSEKHRATLDRDNPIDFIDVYLTAMENDEGLTKDDLAINMFDFLIAGSETSSTTLKWLVLYLALHQDVQDTSS